MFSWKGIFDIKETPQLAQLEIPYVLAVRNLRTYNVYKDVVSIAENIFAETNQRNSLSHASSDRITSIFWADNLDVLLRAVYGDTQKKMSSLSSPPPKELLLAPGCLTYAEIVQEATERGMPYSQFFTPAQNRPFQPYVGVQLLFERLDYYFACGDDENAEMKNWDGEKVAAVGFRTIRMFGRRP